MLYPHPPDIFSIGFCNLIDISLPCDCVGVTYLNTVATANCQLKSGGFDAAIYIVSPDRDSARLLYPGYPAVTDLS